jgi:hypothetical protein
MTKQQEIAKCAEGNVLDCSGISLAVDDIHLKDQLEQLTSGSKTEPAPTEFETGMPTVG